VVRVSFDEQVQLLPLHPLLRTGLPPRGFRATRLRVCQPLLRPRFWFLVLCLERSGQTRRASDPMCDADRDGESCTRAEVRSRASGRLEGGAWLECTRRNSVCGCLHFMLDPLLRNPRLGPPCPVPPRSRSDTAAPACTRLTPQLPSPAPPSSVPSTPLKHHAHSPSTKINSPDARRMPAPPLTGPPRPCAPHTPHGLEDDCRKLQELLRKSGFLCC